MSIINYIKTRPRSHSQKEHPTFKDLRNKGTPTDYIYITDFKKTTLKECQQYDKYNDRIYQNNHHFFENLKKKIGNRPIELNYNYRHPRKPNNVENYKTWQEMNKPVDIIQQTSSTIYLLNKGYQIRKKNFPESQYQPNDDMIIEPYQLISKAKEISKKINESYLNVLKLPKIQPQPPPQQQLPQQPQLQPFSESSQSQFQPQLSNNIQYHKNPPPFLEYKPIPDNTNRYSCPGEIASNLPNYPTAPEYQYSNNTNH